MLVADDEDGGVEWFFEIAVKPVPVFHILRLLDDDDLIFGHHGKAPGHIDHLCSRRIHAIDDCLVEVALLGGHDIVLYIVRDLVYIIWFLSHQYIDRLELACLEVGHDGLESLFGSHFRGFQS